jgi:hypothetical protein
MLSPKRVGTLHFWPQRNITNTLPFITLLRTVIVYKHIGLQLETIWLDMINFVTMVTK